MEEKLSVFPSAEVHSPDAAGRLQGSVGKTPRRKAALTRVSVDGSGTPVPVPPVQPRPLPTTGHGRHPASKRPLCLLPVAPIFPMPLPNWNFSAVFGSSRNQCFLLARLTTVGHIGVGWTWTPLEPSCTSCEGERKEELRCDVKWLRALWECTSSTQLVWDYAVTGVSTFGRGVRFVPAAPEIRGVHKVDLTALTLLIKYFHGHKNSGNNLHAYKNWS